MKCWTNNRDSAMLGGAHVGGGLWKCSSVPGTFWTGGSSCGVLSKETVVPLAEMSACGGSGGGVTQCPRCGDALQQAPTELPSFAAENKQTKNQKMEHMQAHTHREMLKVQPLGMSLKDKLTEK